MVAGMLLGILEVLAPGWIFLGFAVGALGTGLLLWVGGPLGASMAGSLPMLLLVFAVLSLVAWLVLRRVFGLKGGSVTTFDSDINDD
jgi:membrane protein implicated in regulation of membrane protease activity